MYRHPLFILWFSVLTLLALIHHGALLFFWYWTYPWLDTFTHFLGGLFVGLSSLWFVFESRYVHIKKSAPTTLFVVGFSIVIVGISWEVFELMAGIPKEENYAFDTTIDVTMDVFGAFLAWLIFIRFFLCGSTHPEKHVYE